MKGITLLSDLFLLLAMLGLTIMMTMFLWYMIIIYEVVVQPFGLSTPREVELRLFMKPVEYDSIMLSFLEFEYEGIPMKKIINLLAIQGKTDIWIEGKQIDAMALSEEFLNPLINKDYLLIISPADIVIASLGNMDPSVGPLGIHKVSTEVFSLNGETNYLKLYVRD